MAENERFIFLPKLENSPLKLKLSIRIVKNSDFSDFTAGWAGHWALLKSKVGSSTALARYT